MIKKLLFISLFFIMGACHKNELPEKLTLHFFHTNDLHAHLEAFDPKQADCSHPQANCLGGFDRIQTVQEEIIRKYPDLIVLDAGDRFSGTAFYAMNKSRNLSETLNEMHYDAMTLGNHEFDDGLKELSVFAAKNKAPLVSANVSFPHDQKLSDEIKPFVILKRHGQKIGVVGLLTEETKTASSHGREIDIRPVFETALKQVQELKKQNVKHIVFLTHLGLDVDKKLAQQVPEIDVIVGAHTHSLLSNDPEEKSAVGPYPLVVQGPTGQDVLIVSVGMGGRHVGVMQVDFDASGVPIGWQGEALAVSHEIKPDLKMQTYIATEKEKIEARLNGKVGFSPVLIGLTPEKTFCSESCFVGEVITELFLASEKKAQIAFMNAGGIRSSLPKGEISYQNLIEAIPFDSKAMLVELSGQEILSYLSYGIQGYSSQERTNAFLHAAGLSYDFSETTKEISRVLINGEPLNPEKKYQVLFPSFIAEGGDGYPVAPKPVLLSKTLQERVLEMLPQKDNFVFENRIRKLP